MSNDPKYMRDVGEVLAFHKIIEKPEELTEDNFDDMIIELQRKANIHVDGGLGRETLWALQFPWVLQSREQMWVKCEADVVPGIKGDSETILREEAAARYQSLRSDVLNLGGVMTADGGRRELTAPASAGRSAKSLHYTGIAFDLVVESGYFKPDTAPYVITRGENTCRVVWWRARGGTEMEIAALYWKNWNSVVDLKKKVRGKFFNFTELCRKHGFTPIPPRARSPDRTTGKTSAPKGGTFRPPTYSYPAFPNSGSSFLR